jgi:uncharacterized membrane protein YfcA
MENIIYVAVIFVAVFTQSLSGFGSALVSMPLLAPLFGLHVATPLVALMGGVMELILLTYYRESLNIRAVWRLVLASIVGIPAGVYLLQKIDEKITLTILGIVIVGYALYALLNFKLPKLENPLWSYIAGFFAGLLSGAYNTAGPPVIIYGNCRKWEPAEFKANLQGFFIINNIFVILSHALAGNITPLVWSKFLIAIPVVVVAIIAGISLEKHLSAATFRKVVLVLLVVVGVRLFF